MGFFLIFSSSSFMVSGLTFKSLIHFEFVSGLRQGFSFIVCHVNIQFPQHHLLKRLSFLHCVFLLPCQKSVDCVCVGLTSGLSTIFHWLGAFFMPVSFHQIYWLHRLLVAALRMFSLCWGMWGPVPWPGIEPGPPAMGVWSLSHWTTREVPMPVCFIKAL